MNQYLIAGRTAASAALAGLGALIVLYPHNYTLVAALAVASAVLGTLGIHAIPSVGQKSTSGDTLTEAVQDHENRLNKANL
jgi:hypothetical protein